MTAATPAGRSWPRHPHLDIGNLSQQVRHAVACVVRHGVSSWYSTAWQGALTAETQRVFLMSDTIFVGITVFGAVRSLLLLPSSSCSRKDIVVVNALDDWKPSTKRSSWDLIRLFPRRGGLLGSTEQSAIMARCLFNEKRTLKRRKLTVLTNNSEQNKTKRDYNFPPVDIYVIDICISTPRCSLLFTY